MSASSQVSTFVVNLLNKMCKYVSATHLSSVVDSNPDVIESLVDVVSSVLDKQVLAISILKYQFKICYVNIFF